MYLSSTDLKCNEDSIVKRNISYVFSSFTIQCKDQPSVRQKFRTTPPGAPTPSPCHTPWRSSHPKRQSVHGSLGACWQAQQTGRPARSSYAYVGGSCCPGSMDGALDARSLCDELLPTYPGYSPKEGGISLQMIGSPGDGCCLAASLSVHVVPSTLWRSFAFASRLVNSRGGDAHSRGGVLYRPREVGERW